MRMACGVICIMGYVLRVRFGRIVSCSANISTSIHFKTISKILDKEKELIRANTHWWTREKIEMPRPSLSNRYGKSTPVSFAMPSSVGLLPAATSFSRHQSQPTTHQSTTLTPSVAPLAPPLSTADTISLPPSLLSLESTAAIELLLVQPSSAWILSTAAAIAAFPPLGTPLLAADPIVGGECLRNGQTQQQ